MSTTEDEIKRLDGRVTRLETGVSAKLDAIEEKVSNLAVLLAARRECPEPGACVYLRAELNNIAARVNTHGLEIRALERWQWKIAACLTMAGTILAFFLTVFGPSIRGWLGLP